MKINYGINKLYDIHEHIKDIIDADPLTIEWISCGTFLAEVYELEVTKHGGLDSGKIKAYKDVCRKFLRHEDELDQ